jgi:hypothetical protein
MNRPALRPLDLELLRKQATKYGPVFTWTAIRDCIKHKREFPDWINDYLVGCTDRMLSDQARLSKDARQELSWIFEFSGYKEALDPMRQITRKVLRGGFARRFALWILRGKEPDDAFDKAKGDSYSNECLVKLVHPRRKRKQKQKAAGDEDNAFSDKQLKRDLKEEFQLKTLPDTREEWLPEILRYFVQYFERLPFEQLERDLKEKFQLKTLPDTREEWPPEILRYLVRYFERLVPFHNH